MLCKTHDSKKCWYLYRQLLMDEDNRENNDMGQDAWKQYITDLFFKTSHSSVIPTCNNLCGTYKFPFGILDILKVISKMKSSRAPGPDGLANIVIKQNPKKWAVLCLHLFIGIWETGIIPDSWRKAIVIPIFKKGDRKLPDNYRLLAMADSSCKIFCSLLVDRLNYWIEEKGLLSAQQTGSEKDIVTWII